MNIEKLIRIELIESVQKTDWCHRFEPILLNSIDNDSYEKTLDALLSLIKYCKEKLRESNINKTLSELKEKLIDKHIDEENEAERTIDENDSYYAILVNKIEIIQTYLRN